MQDAHLHLQDPKFQNINNIIQDMRTAGIQKCVVNGTSPHDWPRVKELARTHPDLIIPSYGFHPWNTPDNNNWKKLLINQLKQEKTPCIGECGLDRSIHNLDTNTQEQTFLYQLNLATQKNYPLSIHIVKAWGSLLDILRARKASSTQPHPDLPKRGFLLHAYNGPPDIIPELTKAGAYFSLAANTLNKNKLHNIPHIPINRILIESDAPNLLPPKELITHPLNSHQNTPINHPANLIAISTQIATQLNLSTQELNKQITKNFSRFFLENQHPNH